MKRIISPVFVIVAWILLLLLILASVCKADVSIVNGSTNLVSVTGSVEMTLQPGQAFSFVPASSATNAVTIGGSCFPLADGTLYAVDVTGTVTAQAVLHSAYDDDSVMSSYFLNGLEMGTGLAVVLFGYSTVKKALRLGDVWAD